VKAITIGCQIYILSLSYSNVFLTRASGIFPLGVVLCKWAVEHNIAMFSKLYTSYQGKLAEASTRSTSNNANLMSSC